MVVGCNYNVLEDPVIAMDHQTYNRATITQHIDWCVSKGKPVTSPLTNEPMEVDLMPNLLVRRLVSDYVEEKKRQWREQQQQQQQG